MKIISLLLCIILAINMPIIKGMTNPDSELDSEFYLPDGYIIEDCDLNKDGYTDIVFANFYDGISYSINSYIYWGSKSGYSETNRTPLPTEGGHQVLVVDLNKDEWSDIIFGNYYNGSYNLDSYIYWGSPSGYSVNNRTELPTHAPNGISVSDFNKDGYLDIVFSNAYNGSSYVINSYIYWGSGSGYSASNKTELPTIGATGVSVNDLNRDKWPDIIFSNVQNSASFYEVNSYIYWGSPQGYSTSNRTELPTNGAEGIAVSDFNKDGHLDIAFANYRNNSSFNINSYIYWGSGSGYSASNKTELPTKGAFGVSSSDLNKDGWKDIIFTNYYNGSYNLDSYIYWGSSSGYSQYNKTNIPTHGCQTVSICDLNKDGWQDILLSNHFFGTLNTYSYIYWGSSSNDYSAKTELPTSGSTGATAIMISYAPKSEESLRPKLEALMKHMQGRMHNIERLLAEIETKLPPEIPDEIQEKLDQVEELIKEAGNSKSPSEANKLLNEARDILNEILNSLL